MLLKCCIQHATKFGKCSSGHRTGKGQFSFQSQRNTMPNFVQTTAQLHSSHTLASNVQNSPSKVSTVRKPRTSRCSSWMYKKQRNQRSDCQHPLHHRKRKRIPENIYFCFIDYTKSLTVWSTTQLWKILQEMGIPDHLPCLLRNLYTG